jgi:voltage-gated potassium channel
MASIANVPPRDDQGARLAWIDALEARFSPVASALGILFVLVVVGENLAEPDSDLRNVFLIAGWAIWGVFVVEFALRAVLAPSTASFLRRNWWQVVFLVLPFLRFIAALRLARVARAGRIVSSAVRGTRSAGRVLRDRIVWIAMVHTIVVLAVSQLLYEFGDTSATYGATLHAVALASVSGEPLGFDGGLAQVLEVVLAIYAVVVFATAAATVGAYLLERRGEQAALR